MIIYVIDIYSFRNLTDINEQTQICKLLCSHLCKQNILISFYLEKSHFNEEICQHPENFLLLTAYDCI